MPSRQLGARRVGGTSSNHERSSNSEFPVGNSRIFIELRLSDLEFRVGWPFKTLFSQSKLIFFRVPSSHERIEVGDFRNPSSSLFERSITRPQTSSEALNWNSVNLCPKVRDIMSYHISLLFGRIRSNRLPKLANNCTTITVGYTLTCL